MRNLSNEFKNLLARDSRNYLCYADITLSDQTALHVGNSELWDGGFFIEDAVSDDNSFSALGSAIIGSANIVINNIYGDYSEYDFSNAEVALSVGMAIGNTIEKIKLGTYRVDDPNYDGDLITLSLLDYMEQFDRPYVTNLAYPATLYEIANDACLKCGVTLGTTTFPHYNYNVSVKPDSESTTFREVISWVAAIAGCFARCDKDGKLTFGWFDASALDTLANEDNLDGGTFDSTSAQSYQSGDSADGGTFNPWSTGYSADGGSLSTLSSVHFISSLKSVNTGVDDTVITGVSITVENGDVTPVSPPTGVSVSVGTDKATYSKGTAGYVIHIEENPLITRANAGEITAWLASQLIGLTFRKMTLSHLNDPSIESGDVARVIDHKGNNYNILVTRVTFGVGQAQTIVCGSESVSKNSSRKFTESTKNYLKAKKELKAEQTAREQALQDLSSRLAAQSGLYTTIETPQSGGNIYYMHDKPTLAESHVVWKMTAEAWGVTTQYNAAHPDQTVWNGGMAVDGNVIANILSANGVNADWVRTGRLRSADGSVYIDLDNNVISINGQTTFLSANDVGANGTTTIDGGRITTGIIEGGGTSNDPNFKLVMSTGELTMKNGSINIGNGKFQVDTSGNLTAQNAALEGNIITKGANNYWMRMADGYISGGISPSGLNNVCSWIDCTDVWIATDNDGNSTINRHGALLGSDSAIRLCAPTLYVGSTSSAVSWNSFYQGRSATITINGTSYKFVNGILVYDHP